MNQTLLEFTKPMKTKRDCVVSRMPSTVRDKYFRCTKVDLVVELFNEAFRYGTGIQERFTRGEREEKKYVQK